MPDELPHDGSLPEFYAAIGGTLYLDIRCTVHRLEDLHGEIPCRSQLFRADDYAVVLIASGRTIYHIDGASHETSPGTTYFTNPGHAKGFEIHEPATGLVITFSEAFLKESGGADIFDDFPFLIAEVVPPSALPAGSSEQAKLSALLFAYHQQTQPNSETYALPIEAPRLRSVLQPSNRILEWLYAECPGSQHPPWHPAP